MICMEWIKVWRRWCEVKKEISTFLPDRKEDIGVVTEKSCRFLKSTMFQPLIFWKSWSTQKKKGWSGSSYDFFLCSSNERTFSSITFIPDVGNEDKKRRWCEVREGEVKKVKKILEFERSGETLAIEIEMKNVSPMVGQDTISSMLDTLYENTKKAIF